MSSEFWKYFQKVLAWPLIRRPGPLQAIAEGTAHALDSVIDDVIYARKQFFPSLAEEDLVLEHGFGRGLQRKNGETPEKFRSRAIRAWHWHMLGGKSQGLPQILRYYGFDVTAIDNVRQWQPSRWSDFQVRLAQPVTQEEQTALLNSLDLLIWIINEYKPARSVLARVYTTTYNWEPSIWSETAWSYGFWSTFSGVPYDVQGMDGLVVSLGMQREQVAKAIKEHPKAVAVLVNNPTYYGICSDLRAIVKMAHEAGMMCLVDEAHGTHFYFGGGLPVSAMEAGADMASVSMHKSGGSLTQSSLLLTGPDVHAGYVRQIINLTQTTSGSYLLMSSLDISRRNLAQRGRQIFHQVADMAEYAREEINAIGGYYAFGKELVNGNSVFDFDITKLSVHTLDIGLAGIEVYDILRDEYDIQIEFGDIGNILAYLSIGDRAQEVERLVSALAEIRRRFQTDGTGLLSQEYIDPQVVTSPQDAFYADKCSLPLRETEGMVCSEFVMCYPPGIPILAPGERITAEILDYIEYAKAKGCNMTGPEDPDILKLNVLTGR